jgi:Cdc6-like AAA superfamily ATPase
MMTQIRNFRAVLTENHQSFGKMLGKVLSPSQPLNSEEYLKGREEQLQGIKRALYQSGRHVLIHGLRGVGKSSLAQTAAFSLALQKDPIIVGCDSSSTFKSVVREIFLEAVNHDPTLERSSEEVSVGMARYGISLGAKQNEVHSAPDEPASVNEAARLIQFLTKYYSDSPVVVVDEFDQVSLPQEQELFANLIKQVSDKHIDAKFIFCGIGESIDALMSAHASADRYFHTVSLGQLPYEARFEIVENAADKLGIEIDRNTVYRIARISDGFPHFVHFISEQLFWRVHEAENDGLVTPELFERAMSDAADSMDMKLRRPYEVATQKYKNDYEHVLWAAADGHELKRRNSDIFVSYQRIMQELGETPMNRDRFNQRINSLKKPTHGEILTGNRQGWYEFTEKMIRGYVRLKAEQSNVRLEIDHPAGRRRIRPKLSTNEDNF